MNSPLVVAENVWAVLAVDDCKTTIRANDVGFLHLSAPLVRKVMGESRADRRFGQLGVGLSVIRDAAGYRCDPWTVKIRRGTTRKQTETEDPQNNVFHSKCSLDRRRLGLISVATTVDVKRASCAQFSPHRKRQASAGVP